MFDNSDTERDQREHASEIEKEEKALSILETARSTGSIALGTNEVTKAVERGEARLVYVGRDVSPREIVQHIPELCKEKGIPFLYIQEQDSIGYAGGLEVGSAAAAIVDPGRALEEVRELDSITEFGSARTREDEKPTRREDKTEPNDNEVTTGSSHDRSSERVETRKSDSSEDDGQEAIEDSSKNHYPDTVSAKVVEIKQMAPEGGGRARCQLQDGPKSGFVIITSVGESIKEGDEVLVTAQEEYEVADDWSDITAVEIAAPLCELEGTNFTNATLSKGNFRASNLSDSLLTDVDLSNAELPSADLSGATMKRADLFSVDASNADLQGVNLSGANLSGATMTRANLSSVDLSNANLRDTDLSETNLNEANLSGADLSGATLERATLSEATLRETTLQKVELSGVDLAAAELLEIDLADLSKSLMNSSKAVTQGDGVDIAELAIERDLEGTSSLVTTLSEVLLRVDDPSIQISALRSLKKADAETHISSSEFDSLLSALMRRGAESVREVVTIEMSSIVIGNPQEYPETIEALRTALDDPQPKVQVSAAKSLAVIAHDSDIAISDIAGLKVELEELANQPGIPEESITKAIRVVDAAENGAVEG